MQGEEEAEAERQLLVLLVGFKLYSRESGEGIRTLKSPKMSLVASQPLTPTFQCSLVAVISPWPRWSSHPLSGRLPTWAVLLVLECLDCSLSTHHLCKGILPR